jgi:dihydropteroate synthase
MVESDLNRWLTSASRRTLVVGIINMTPDSFSDGGRLSGPEEAADLAEEMVAAGADWLDVGGESTRPGSRPVDPDEQVRRTAPAIAAIRKRVGAIISIDTMSSRVAQEAAGAGANIVNDVSAGRNDPDMLPMIARCGLAVVLMHMQGSPQTMQQSPSYRNVTVEVSAFLLERRDRAADAGVDRAKIIFDAGIGFGKNLGHDLTLLHDTAALAGLGQPLMVGPSRKRFIGEITGEKQPEKRVAGTAAVVAWCVAAGAAAVRVHDVGPITQTVRMIEAISSQKIRGIS